MWAVFDNNKPASNVSFPHAGKEYNNHKFTTFIEAVDYARRWLGFWDKIPADIKEGELKLNISGFGDMLEIRDLDKPKEEPEEISTDNKIKQTSDLQYKLKKIVEFLSERQYMRVGNEKVITNSNLKNIEPGMYEFLIENKGYTLSSNNNVWKLTRVS